MRMNDGDYSPWGIVQCSEEIAPGYFLVATAGHGGIMIDRSAISTLSMDAQKIGFYDSGYYCFEEDCAEAVVFKELLARPGWDLPRSGMFSYSCSLEEFEKFIDSSIKRYNPQYFEAQRHLFEKQLEFHLER